MNRFVKVKSLLLVLCILFSLSACGNGASSGNQQVSKAQVESAFGVSGAESESHGTRIVTDMMGTEVELPQEVNRVINLWHANNQVVLLLGAADKLIGTTSIVKDLQWYNYVYPGIAEVPVYALQAGSGNFNTEEILTADADVVITSSADDAQVLRKAGIPTVVVTFRDFDGLKETVRVTAEVLGGDAPQRAEEYCAYFDSNLSMLEDRVEGLGMEERPKVYEIRGQELLQTDGKDSICTQWVEAAGGINVAAALSDDNMCEVVLEEVLNADPDVIIVATQNAHPIIEQLQRNNAWSSVKAVRDGKIYANPIGTFLWSRYSCEEALQVLWTAKTLHPDLFEDLDMTRIVQKFYMKFYDCDLSNENVESMLQGLDPI